MVYRGRPLLSGTCPWWLGQMDGGTGRESPIKKVVVGVGSGLVGLCLKS